MPTKDSQPQKKYGKVLVSVFISLFFTPIIEKLLTNIYNEFVHKILSMRNAFSLFVSSFFYSRISEGVYINISFYIFIIIITLILIKIIYPYIPNRFPCGIKKFEKCGKKSSCGLSRRTKCLVFCAAKHRVVKSLLFAIIYIVFILFLLTTNFINKTITRTTNNIEIVSPYITDYEYKKLKSDFHSMKNSIDYKALTQNLDSIAKENTIELK